MSVRSRPQRDGPATWGHLVGAEMFNCRIVAVAVLALALAACQQGGAKPSAAAAAPTGTQASKPKAGEHVATGVFEERQKELSYKFAERLLRGCVEAMSSESDMNTCFRSRTLEAFDSSGLAAKHCPERPEDLDGEVACIVTGSAGYHVAQDFDAVEKFDWSDPDASINKIVVDFILAQLQGCLGGSSASSPDDCLNKAFVDRLALPDTDVKLCMALTEDFKQGQCLGEAYALRFIADGIEKL